MTVRKTLRQSPLCVSNLDQLADEMGVTRTRALVDAVDNVYRRASREMVMGESPQKTVGAYNLPSFTIDQFTRLMNAWGTSWTETMTIISERALSS